MKVKKSVWMLLCLLFMGTVVFSGCGGDDNSPTSPENPLNVSGNWDIKADGYSNIRATLSHSGTTVTATDLATYHVGQDGSPQFDNTAEKLSGSTESPVGSTGSRTITLHAKFVGTIGSITMTGTVNKKNDSMSGTYIDNLGGHGNWTATLLQ
ncbi:hypothetical protein CSA57_05610 [candidate division KSB3 bacterium]|nr:MAG: hypothetical protein CSA57_05610 [candidate division KSB3 bacterium]